MASKLLILGEAPGEAEMLAGKPFVGPAGQELASMFRDVNLPYEEPTRNTPISIDRQRVALDNVFTNRPPSNSIEKWCVSAEEARKAYLELRQQLVESYPYPWPETYTWVAIAGTGKYLHPLYLPALPKLRDRLITAAPSLILATGNIPCWALLNQTGIGKLRGVPRMATTPVFSGKILPVYHPAAILRQFSLRAVTMADLMKIPREIEMEGANYTSYSLIVQPTEQEVLDFIAEIQSSDSLSVDIETARGVVTCIGFATARVAICIPIVKLDFSFYWPNMPWAFSVIQQILNLPNAKIFQNGAYDLQYIWRRLGMTVRNASEDTMLIHHTLQPEMPKGLAFLASVYTQAANWKELSGLSKMMSKMTEGKKDD